MAQRCTNVHAVLGYVDYFSRIKRANDWSDEAAGKIFPAMLPSNERILMKIEDMTKFSDMVAVVNTMEEPFREAKLMNLMKLMKKPSETINDFRIQVTNLVSEVYSGFREEDQEQLVRDFLLHGLPDEIKTQVIQLKMKTLDDLVNASQMVESIIQKEKDLICATNDKEESENVAAMKSRRERSDFICYTCGGKNHMAKVCPSKKFGRQFTLKKVGDKNEHEGNEESL